MINDTLKMPALSVKVPLSASDATRESTLIRDEQLVAELNRLGVDHLARLRPEIEPGPITAVELLVALAEHPEARLRSALILLFLRQPNFSRIVGEAISQVSADAANTLRLYYQAAFYIQNAIEPELRACLPDWQPLPDLFSKELNLPPPTTVASQEGLTALGHLHRQLSGWAYNWAGSYWQNIPVFVKHLRHSSCEQLNA